jgi:hypothetical protein
MTERDSDLMRGVLMIFTGARVPPLLRWGGWAEKARAAGMSARKRKEIAKKAAKTRWGK